VLASIAIRPSFLIGELLLGKLSETVVVVGDAPHDRPGFLMCHLVGNCASFLSSKAPMLRVPSKLSDHQLTSDICPLAEVSWSLEKPSSPLIEHDGSIHFEERSLDRRLRQLAVSSKFKKGYKESPGFSLPGLQVVSRRNA
jgi:hypothetical protein